MARPERFELPTFWFVGPRWENLSAVSSVPTGKQVLKSVPQLGYGLGYSLLWRRAKSSGLGYKSVMGNLPLYRSEVLRDDRRHDNNSGSAIAKSNVRHRSRGNSDKFGVWAAFTQYLICQKARRYS